MFIVIQKKLSSKYFFFKLDLKGLSRKSNLLQTERMIGICNHEITELPEVLLWLHLCGILAKMLY